MVLKVNIPFSSSGAGIMSCGERVAAGREVVVTVAWRGLGNREVDLVVELAQERAGAGMVNAHVDETWARRMATEVSFIFGHVTFVVEVEVQLIDAMQVISLLQY